MVHIKPEARCSDHVEKESKKLACKGELDLGVWVWDRLPQKVEFSVLVSFAAILLGII